MSRNPIFLKNTLSGEKESFVPLVPDTVSMYHCGPTVYDFAHIGNMRSYVFADILRRTFESNGYKVKQVINITDVGHIVADADAGEDKIEKAAKEKELSPQEITEYYLDSFIKDLRDLHIRTHGTHFPHASEHIKEQIELIKKLEAKGYTYKTSDGVYFDTSKYPDYGKLGNIDTEHLKEGARIAVNKERKNITDFALWKLSHPDEKRLQEWPSPWGIGFPGWHIECSAMSMKYLGETFDIHTGGIDHIPVHHNNEIAQSECATGKPYATYWLHNAFIRVDEQKMSKSLGNIITVSDIKAKNIPALALRYWFLGGRYSSQMNFTWEALADSERAREKLEHWYRGSPKGGSVHEKTWGLFITALSDDLDTPKGIAILWDMLKDESIPEADKHATAHAMNQILAIFNEHVSVFSDEIKDLIEKREKARAQKNWALSDTLRTTLETKGVHVEDGKNGTKYL